MGLSARQIRQLGQGLADKIRERKSNLDSEKSIEEVFQVLESRLDFPEPINNLHLVTVDRVSNSGNLICRQSPQLHLRKVTINHVSPSPGEKWIAYPAEDHSQYVELHPMALVEQIDDYTQTRKHTTTASRSPQNRSQADKDSKTWKELTDPYSVTGGKNSIISGKKL